MMIVLLNSLVKNILMKADLLKNFLISQVSDDKKTAIRNFEENLSSYDSFTLIVAVIVIVNIRSLAVSLILYTYKNFPSLERVKTLTLKFLLLFMKSRLKDEKQKLHEFCNQYMSIMKFSSNLQFNSTGHNIDTVVEEIGRLYLQDHSNGDKMHKKSGCTFTHVNPEINSILKTTGEVLGYSSGISPCARQMESQLIETCADLFHGDSLACGLTTSGGTESILMAVLALRNRARSLGISEFELIAPVTIHAAFDKACHLFGVHLIKIKLDARFIVDIKQVNKFIGPNTIGIAASLVNYPHGMIDDIDALSKMGKRSNIPIYVDACMGGFVYAFYNRANIQAPVCDFRLPGVSIISCDLHKYGLSPKGLSVVLFRDRELRRYCSYSFISNESIFGNHFY